MANEFVNAYIKELKLVGAKDRAGMNAALEKAAGRHAASAIRAAIEDERMHDTAYMDLCNSQLSVSLAVTGIMDLWVLRSVCEYIMQYNAAFGKKILDTGCGNGVLSCFIARAYPDSEIIAIDRSPSAIRCAKLLAQRLGLHNIRFIASDIRDLEEGQFDTVFCARNIAENLAEPKVPEQDYWYDELAAETVGQERMHGFVVALASHLAPDGCLVSIEDMQRDPLFYAYLTTLNELEVGVIPQTCMQWEDFSFTGDKTVQAFIANRGSRLEHENLYWIWATLLSRGVDMSSPSFEGYISDVFIRRIRGDMLSGLKMYDDNGVPVRKMMLWNSRREQDSNTIYLQQLNMQEHSRSVECYAADARRVVDGYYDRCEKAWRERGRKTERFVLVDGVEKSV